MTPIVVTGTDPAIAVEGFVLDGLNLQTGAYTVAAAKFTPARKRPEWAEATDGDGALLVRDPYSDNSQWDLAVHVDAATRDAAHTAAGLVTDKLEEAERNLLGIPLVWTPADSTKSLTFYVLTGEIAEIPIDIESGYFASQPRLVLNVALTCRPFGYGAEQTVAAVAGTGPLQIFSVANVLGDVPAEARLIVTDTAAQSRDFCAWGLEQRWQAGADLLLTQPDLTATGFAGASATRAGSVSTNVYRATLTTSPVAVVGTGNQPHVGVFRVYARLWASGAGVRVRFTYRVGDGPLMSLEWETPPAEDAWVELDLGVVSIPERVLGTQRWQGQIEAYTDVAGDTLDVDYLIPMPAGRFGRARRQLTIPTSTTFYARDEFDQTAGALTGKTLPAGGTWAGAGDVDDFAVNTTDRTARRTAVSDAGVTGDISSGRWVIAGTTVFTEVAASIDMKASALRDQHVGLVLRHVDSNNFAAMIVEWRATGGMRLSWWERVGGILTDRARTAQGAISAVAGSWYTLLVTVSARGLVGAWFGPRTGLPSEPAFTTVQPAAATGGALASGNVGFLDHHPGSGANTRDYDNFSAFVPLADAVCFSAQSVEFRWDETLREDPTGTYYGRPQEYRGAPFFLPPAGDEGRTSRIPVMLRRSDVYSMPNASVADGQSVEVRYTPRYRYLPR